MLKTQHKSLPTVHFMPFFVLLNQCCHSLSLKCVFESPFKCYCNLFTGISLTFKMHGRISDIKEKHRPNTHSGNKYLEEGQPGV